MKTATTPVAGGEHVRLPGLYQRWELEQVLEAGVEFLFEEAGNASDGTPLFIVYRREHTTNEEL
ncbi:hypothetical protein LZC95_50030 [Pendulispora brunnea]|uniref:Uncharacterized protein n=1 Tax=Pendulispora brunnea TaxID=2905690 RepID=A0ABZ2K782_9BACT